MSLQAYWPVVEQKLQGWHQNALNELVSAKEYKEMVRAQEKVKVLRSLLAMKDEFTKKE